MNSVVQSNINFVDASPESGFLMQLITVYIELVFYYQKKVASQAKKYRHKRNCLRLKTNWNTYKKEAQQKYVNTIFLKLIKYSQKLIVYSITQNFKPYYLIL